jgi:SOS-response transcriptional repressor LexA
VAESALGRVIRLAREREGLTQRNLADAIEREQGYVSKIENGHTPAPDWVLRRWAPMLRVSYNVLVLARAGITGYDVEEDAREVTVRYAGIMPADAVRWTEMFGRDDFMHVWAPMLGMHAPERCFVIQVSGDCLLTQGIRDGRFVLLRTPNDHEIPVNGTIVAARIGDECSLKIWWLTGTEIRLTDGDGHTVYRGQADAPDFQLLGIYLNDWKPIEGMR